MEKGISGKIAKAFLESKLTVLLMIAFMLVGIFSSYLIPREEEPQIEVPMADVFLRYPGATPKEVETKIAAPLEKIISNLPGVEHIYSTSMSGQAMIIVQFYVKEDIERSFVQLYNEILKHMDQMPQGVSMPLIKTRAVDDVPMQSLTFWSETYNDFEIKQLAEEVNNQLKSIKGIAATKIIGGRSREISVVLDKDKMAQNHVDILGITQKINANNQQSQVGHYNANDTEILVNAGNFLKSVDDVNNLIIGVYQQKPVYLKQVATVKDGAEIPNEYVSFGYGKADDKNKADFKSEYAAVTLSISKQKGGDAMKLADKINSKIALLKKSLIPNDIHVSVTRNYGQTASDKVSELLMHLMIAIIAVTLLVMLAMGWRGALVVFLSIPVTFALTLFSYYFMDYTLNRITLFALVFVTGIVVDDSIIIAENMHRHFKSKRLPFKQAAIFAINEVGNPTILATFTVVASILPMAFVSGLMGPYMSPMPIGASIAMVFSLLVALTITPYLGLKFLQAKEKHGEKNSDAPKKLEDSKLFKIYIKLINPLIDNKKIRFTFFGVNILLLVISIALFFTKSVAVKMLPFDNKNEFQIVIDMPEGTTLERTAVVTKEIAQYISKNPLVKDYQSYVGTASPITFNGLVRHYDLRRGSNIADIQVNLVGKSERSKQSHDIVKEVRPAIIEIAKHFNANVKVVEVPPGPPVLSTIVAEVYGPDYDAQINIADQLKTLITNTKNVVDVDWMVEAPQQKFDIVIDKEKAMLNGIAPQQIVSTLQLALTNQPIDKLYDENSDKQIGIVLQLGEDQKSSIDAVLQLKVISQNGVSMPLSNLVKIVNTKSDKSIFRKNQQRVVYITADMAGDLESPVYAILDLSKQLKNIKMPKGEKINELYNGQPADTDKYSIKWDGEWQITYDVFRDLGAAFAVVIIIIYMLLVGWFQSFKAPVVMMIAIPLSLTGIVFGHLFLGAYFTATSMIGLIALAGIMVRNSVLLIDFINLRLADGIPLRQAVIEAGAVRTTPILLTAGAVAIGAVVMLFDPIFQGLAISLIGGTLFSTFLTLLMIPLIYYYSNKPKNI
ncbi:MAG: efflux RND transporter permease subunit [Flavobacteriales bacterium]|jgi:multidrug efflux pump subunit AcrB|nr:efflux RND transporter permease subunit [Flavobacteriales bacterium]